jgi:hypothetical protein
LIDGKYPKRCKKSRETLSLMGMYVLNMEKILYGRAER